MTKPPKINKGSRKEFTANLSEIPGLGKDLKLLKLKTGAKTNAELISLMSFAYRNTGVVDPIFKTMLKPDSECTESDRLKKSIIGYLYRVAGYKKPEVDSMILDYLIESYQKMKALNRPSRKRRNRRSKD